MRKRRTRQHQIEDLSYNFVEKQVLDAFCIMKRFVGREYGHDAEIETFSNSGETESGTLYVQVKATDKLKVSKKGYHLTLEKRDLELWLDEIYPVIVVLYDARSESGYFVELHSYFEQNRLVLENLKESKTVYIDVKNGFTPNVVKKFRKVKNLKHGKIKKL